MKHQHTELHAGVKQAVWWACFLLIFPFFSSYPYPLTLLPGSQLSLFGSSRSACGGSCGSETLG
jgi:hypothetical protein